MRLNEGQTDRTIRMLVGIFLTVLASLGVIGAWGWIGLIPLVTGAIGYCPIYEIFGWSTKGHPPPGAPGQS